MFNFIVGLLIAGWFIWGIISTFNFGYAVTDCNESLKVKHILAIMVFLPHYLVTGIVILAMLGFEKIMRVFTTGKIGEFLNKEIKKSK